jgi:Fe-S-cluster containining protein
MYASGDPIFGTFELGRHQVPGIWRYLLPEDLAWVKVPAERLATCNDCYMVAEGEFDAACQCCTYFPEVPNFMVGLGLLDPSSAPGLAALVSAGDVLPQGLVASPLRFRRAVAVNANDRFGREPAMRCPLANPETLDCSIYAYRNSVCSTFFCTNDHGETGEVFWGALQDVLGRIETGLSQWAMTMLGLDAAAYHAQLDSLAGDVEQVFDAATGAWSAKTRQLLFGKWFGREHEFLVAAAELAMKHRDSLYQIATEQPRHTSLVFDRAVRDWVPEEHRHEVPHVAEEPGDKHTVGELWYKAELSARRLWALPFGEGRVGLSPAARIEANAPGQGRASKPFRVVFQGLPRFLTEPEASALRLFTTPQALGEAVLQRPELTALEDARGFLAECMRQGVLVQVKR